MPIYVYKAKCPQDHVCPAMRVCPVSALSQEGFDAPVVDKDKCIECGACSRLCPMGALQFMKE